MFAAALALTCLTLWTAPALPAVVVTDGWTRATPPGADNGSGYLTIHATAADRLIAVETAAARRGEIHSMSMAGGTMTMRPLPEGIEIPAGKTIALAPGGLHLMFFGIRAPFVAGAKIPITLRFEKADPIRVELEVRPIGAR